MSETFVFSENGIQKLKDGFKQLGLDVSSSQIDQLIKYWSIVERVNKKMNLTRIVGDEAITHHLLDSAAIIPNIKNIISQNQLIDKSKKVIKLLDVGSGCGVPGVVLKILIPEINVVLLDSLQKRVIFLKDVIFDLKLENIETIHTRIEDYTEQFDIVICRAFSSLLEIFKTSRKNIYDYGMILAMKGPKAKIESDELSASLSEKIITCKCYQISVPYLNEDRYLVALQ